MTLPAQCRSSLSWVVHVNEEVRLARLGSASPLEPSMCASAQEMLSIWKSHRPVLPLLMVLFKFLFQERRFKVHDGRKRRTGKSEARIVAHF